MGQLDNTIIVFTTDNGAEVITFPDGGVTPFKGGKLTTWEGGMRAPLVVRWPGHIKPGTVKNQMFSRPRLGADARRHRRRPQGRRAEEADRGRPISRHRQDDARRRSTSATISEGTSTSPRATSSSTTPARRRRRCGTRTGRCTSRWCPAGADRLRCWGRRSYSTGRSSRTSSVIRSRSRRVGIDPEDPR